MEVDSQQTPQHTNITQEDTNAALLQNQLNSPAVGDPKAAPTHDPVGTHGHLSVGVKRSASDTELTPKQPLKITKLEEQSQTVHTAEQIGLPLGAMTAPGGESAGKAASCIRQTASGEPIAITEGVPAAHPATSPGAMPADTMPLGVCVDLKPVKLTWNPVVVADPSGPAKTHVSPTQGQGSSGGQTGRPVFNWCPVAKAGSPRHPTDLGTAAPAASAAAAHAAEASLEVASAHLAPASAAPVLLQSPSSYPTDMKIQDEHEASAHPVLMSTSASDPQAIIPRPTKGEHEAELCIKQASDGIQRQPDQEEGLDSSHIDIKAEGPQGSSLLAQDCLVQPQSSVTQPQGSLGPPSGSAGLVLGPGIKMLHPGLGHAVPQGCPASLGPTIAVPTEEAMDACINKLDSAAGQALPKGGNALPAVAKSTSIPSQRKPEALGQLLSARDDSMIQASTLGFGGTDFSALLESRKQELLGMCCGACIAM